MTIASNKEVIQSKKWLGCVLLYEEEGVLKCCKAYSDQSNLQRKINHSERILGAKIGLPFKLREIEVAILEKQKQEQSCFSSGANKHLDCLALDCPAEVELNEIRFSIFEEGLLLTKNNSATLLIRAICGFTDQLIQANRVRPKLQSTKYHMI